MTLLGDHGRPAPIQTLGLRAAVEEREFRIAAGTTSESQDPSPGTSNASAAYRRSCGRSKRNPAGRVDPDRAVPCGSTPCCCTRSHSVSKRSAISNDLNCRLEPLDVRHQNVEPPEISAPKAAPTTKRSQVSEIELDRNPCRPA